jgi:hypothetical protein
MHAYKKNWPADVEENHMVVREHVADAVAVISNGAEASSRWNVLGVLFLGIPTVLFVCVYVCVYVYVWNVLGVLLLGMPTILFACVCICVCIYVYMCKELASSFSGFQRSCLLLDTYNRFGTIFVCMCEWVSVCVCIYI